MFNVAFTFTFLQPLEKYSRSKRSNSNKSDYIYFEAQLVGFDTRVFAFCRLNNPNRKPFQRNEMSAIYRVRVI